MIINLSAKDRDLILKQANPSSQLVQQLRFGVVEGSILRFNLAPTLVEDLLACTDEQVEVGENRKLRRQFERLYQKIFTVAQQQSTDGFSGSIGNPDGFAADPIQSAKELLMSREFESMDDLNATLSRFYKSHNSEPQADFQGLSPDHVTALIYSAWTASDEGLQCNDSLSFDEVDKAEILHNARVFLEALRDNNGTKATPKGNLNRKFVSSMVDTMRWPKGYIEDIWRFNKVLNEEDVRELNVLNIVCGLAGLSRKYKGKFVITRKGKSLLDEETAGELYALLFRTYMRRFNMGYTDRFEEYQGVQDTLAYTVYVLGKKTKGWASLATLSRKVFLPAVSETFETSQYMDEAEGLLYIRVIPPLIRFGLFEEKKVTDTNFPRLVKIKKLPLFDAFLSFELPG